MFVRVDILHRRRDGRWRLIEVKSTAGLKEQHLDDVAIQYRVVSRSGVDLASSCLAHVNRNYVFQGGSHRRAAVLQDQEPDAASREVAAQAHIPVRSELRVLVMPKAPDIPPGPHCTNPVTCEFFDRCNPPRPDDHIGYLPRLHASAAEELEEMGVESISDIPDDFPLSERQRRACTSVQTGEPWFSAELGKELESLKYPLYFADFESVNPAIPRFSGMRPFDQLPFQWSLHVQREPNAEPEHHEFLPPTAAILDASSLVRCVPLWEIAVASWYITSIRIAAALGTRCVAARVRGADQSDPESSFRFAPHRQKPRLLSSLRRVVLAQSGAACTGARDEL